MKLRLQRDSQLRALGKIAFESHGTEAGTPAATFFAAVFWEYRFSTDSSAPRRVWKKLLNNKKVVNVVAGEGVLGIGHGGNRRKVV